MHVIGRSASRPMNETLKADLQIKGPGLERSLSGVLDLYLEMGLDGTSIAIANPTSRRFIAFEHWVSNDPGETHFRSVLENSELLQVADNFRKVVCSIKNDRCIFVPEPLFDSQTVEEQLSICFGPPHKFEASGFDQLPILSVVNCHYFQSSIHTTIGQRFKQAQFHHASSLRLLYMTSIAGPGKDSLVLVDIINESMQVTVVKASNLMFHNRFEFKTPEELIYYLLLVFEQLHLNPETADVFFTGDINKENESFILAGKYITNCRLSGLPSVYTYEPEFSFLDGSRFFNLFCGPLCVS